LANGPILRYSAVLLHATRASILTLLSPERVKEYHSDFVTSYIRTHIRKQVYRERQPSNQSIYHIYSEFTASGARASITNVQQRKKQLDAEQSRTLARPAAPLAACNRNPQKLLAMATVPWAIEKLN